MDELAVEKHSGYNDRAGETGSSLSGGQKQRVAIARALVRAPSILIMDEATSFLDTATEEEIFNNIRETYPSMTVIYITHRENAVKYADKVLTLEDGRICEKEEIPAK
jgi:ATP-binding cassette subfamily B protein